VQGQDLFRRPPGAPARPVAARRPAACLSRAPWTSRGRKAGSCALLAHACGCAARWCSFCSGCCGAAHCRQQREQLCHKQHAHVAATGAPATATAQSVASSLGRRAAGARQGGAEGLARAGSDGAWALPLGAAVLGVRQLGLAGWEPAECLALENELGAWQAAGGLAEREPALRCARARDYVRVRVPGCSM